MANSDIAELETRISAALGRISQAASALDRPDGVPQEVHDAVVAELETLRRELSATEKRAATLDAEVARLQEALDTETTANAQLRERNVALKASKEAAQGRSNELAETLAGLQDVRKADRDELDALISALDPLVKEQPHA